MDRLIALVLLRWRLELRGMRRAPERLVGLFLLAPFLLLGAGFAAVATYIGVRALAATNPAVVLPALSAMATFIGLFWMISPLLTGLALSETHDLARLLHFPIPFRSLVASSLVANLAQPLVLAKMPVALALAAALAERPACLPLTVVGVLLSFVFMLAAVQVGGLVLLGLSRRRRFQDLSLFLGLGAGFALSLLPVLVLTAGPGTLRALSWVALDSDLFGLSPFGWGVRAAVHGGRGETGPFAVLALLAMGAIGAALGASMLLMRRIHRGELDLGGPEGAGAAVRARMRFAGALGTLFEKDLRVAWRDPALKAGLLISLTGPLLFVLFFSRTAGRGLALLLLAVFVGVSVFGTNTFGLERRGIGLLMAFPVARWRVLVAKNLAAMALRLPGLLMLAVAGLVIGPLALLPAALTIALIGLFISAAVDNYASILFPLPAPAPGRAPGAAGGRGLFAVVLSGLLLTAALAVAAPFMFLAALPLPAFLGQPWLWPVTLPLALAGAGAVYAMLVAGAERLLVRRERDVLERILAGEAA